LSDTKTPPRANRGLDPVVALLFKGAGALSSAEMDLLVAELEAFQRAGGHFSWNEWRLLDQDTKDAAVAAGNRIRLQEALLLAAAVQGPEAAAALNVPLDGGDMLADVVVKGAAERMRAKATEVRQ
jgi:hypothetical protein